MSRSHLSTEKKVGQSVGGVVSAGFSELSNFPSFFLLLCSLSA